MARGMIHLNGNILCAVDVETTGLEVGFHEIWQIAVLPLDSNIKPNKDILPFYVNMKINYPERIDPKAIGSRQAFAEMQQRAMDPFTAADLLGSWVERLELPIYKKICPIAQNYIFDREFIKEWLGHLNFEHLFHFYYRDTMAAAIWDSDMCNFKGEKILFTEYGLRFLGNKLKVHNEKPHDALQDCITTAEIYRRMLMRNI